MSIKSEDKQRFGQKMDTKSELPIFVKELLQKIEDAPNFKEYYNIITECKQNNKSFEKINASLYKTGNYYLVLGLESDIDFYKELFTELKKNNIGLAPQFVTAAKNKEGFSATLLKVAELLKVI